MKSILLLACMMIGLVVGSVAGNSEAAETAPPNVDLRTVVDFNHGWRFLRSDQANAAQPEFADTDWRPVTLPHTPRIEPRVVVDQWQGTCWYRKRFTIDGNHQEKRVLLKFEGAMQVADVWLNGTLLRTHHGGYLPFTIDITDDVNFGNENLVAVRLRNVDDPEVPPGKPLEKLDFCMYGGLYRNVRLILTNRLHVTDAVSAGQVASGGIFVTYPSLTDHLAILQIKTHLRNERGGTARCKVMHLLIGSDGKIAGQSNSETVPLAASAERSVTQSIRVTNPKTWHPNHPHLYRLRTVLSDGASPVDAVETRIGIRRIAFSAEGGFQINGERLYLRGTNRHQEYPYLGYALSDNAQYRDARKIKEAGFDYVRLSHYPHSPAFMDACDELGLVVMACIPGWQFMGGDTFQQRCYQNCRDLIRRDRNHPCVILWEVSLNETKMGDAFLSQTHQIAHDEYPGDQCFTCGWVDEPYDVFIQARQHGGCHDYANGSKACIISEYGDWEYYAQNAGLDQPGFQNLKKEDRNSRQLRGAGEKRLLQQAMNFQEAANDNRATPAVGDGLWVMFDYNRGYYNNIEASGPMDLFRLPKFAYYFFQSQRVRAVDQESPGAEFRGPMVRIASDWTPDSSPIVRLFSNCEEVELSLNDRIVARQGPDQGRFSRRLPGPPFHFDLGKFEPGVLRAVGSIDGQEVASHEVRTPKRPRKVISRADLGGRSLVADGADSVFVRASIVDEQGTLVPTDTRPVTFQLSGPGRLIGENPVAAEAGIATILIQAASQPGKFSITTSAPGLETGHLRMEAVTRSHR